MITVGDTVTWTWHSRGRATTKTGIVVAVVPPHEHPLPFAPDRAGVDANGNPRPKESYLVKVEGREDLYWPHASRLKVVEQPESFSRETVLTPRQLAEQNKELLEALRDLVDLQGGPALESYREDWESAIQRAEDAIAKAEGRVS